MHVSTGFNRSPAAHTVAHSCSDSHAVSHTHLLGADGGRQPHKHLNVRQGLAPLVACGGQPEAVGYLQLRPGPVRWAQAAAAAAGVAGQVEAAGVI
jgi:hypothetical protein